MNVLIVNLRLIERKNHHYFKLIGLSSNHFLSVLNTIEHTNQEANRQGVSLLICGELAGGRLQSALPLAMGLLKFSITAAEIPVFKHHLRQIDLSDTKDLLTEVLACDGVAEVKTLLEKF